MGISPKDKDCTEKGTKGFRRFVWMREGETTEFAYESTQCWVIRTVPVLEGIHM